MSAKAKQATPKTPKLVVYMDPDLQQKLKEAAVDRGVSVSEFVRSKILFWLGQQENPLELNDIPASREEGYKYISERFFLLTKQLEWQRKFYEEWGKPENASKSFEKFMEERANDLTKWRS
jgi:hypothetical protein